MFRSLNVNDQGTKEALVRLAEEVSQLRREREHQQMLWEAESPPPPPRRGKRDRHGLHIVRGLGLAAAMTLLRHHRSARRVLASAALVTLGTAGALTPDMMQQAPAAQVPAVVHPHSVAHHRHPPAPVILPPAVPARQKRRRPGSDGTARPRASVTPAASPSPSGTPDPDPSVTPGPDPSPSVTPDPEPTCDHPGKDCHGGGEVVTIAEWRALRGLASYHDLS